MMICLLQEDRELVLQSSTEIDKEFRMSNEGKSWDDSWELEAK